MFTVPILWCIVKGMPSQRASECIAKVVIEATSHGLKGIRLLPFLGHECSRLTVYTITICLRGKLSSYKGLRRDLRRYFSGQQVTFSYPIDWQDITPFTQKVLKRVHQIPWAKIETYGRICAQLEPKSSPRAIGAALRRNPVPIIIPCHRVVKQDGSLGGFSPGIWWKKLLLGLEQGTVPKIHLEFLGDG